jgi:hypothetical protein
VNNEHFAKDALATISENASTSALPTDPAFPTAHYPNAIQVMSGGSWSDVADGYFSVRSNNCAYRVLQLNSANNFTTGKAVNLSHWVCYSLGDQVW